MRRFVKAILGVTALLVGGGLILLSLLHSILFGGSFQWRFLLATPLYVLMLLYGKRWLLNELDPHQLALDPSDPLLLEAISKARHSLVTFNEYVDEGRHQCFLKLPLRDESGKTEHIWGIVHERDGDRYNVSLANEPVGDVPDRWLRRDVVAAEVEDWQVVKAPDQIVGGYTVRAIAEILKRDGYRLTRRARRELQNYVAV